jgi:hypothetical protein
MQASTTTDQTDITDTLRHSSFVLRHLDYPRRPRYPWSSSLFGKHVCPFVSISGFSETQRILFAPLPLRV